MTILYYKSKARHSGGIETRWLYGLDIIEKCEQRWPDVKWKALSGLTYAELRDEYKKADLLIRPARHDGLPCMVLEALHFGCQAICTVPVPGAKVVSIDDFESEVERAIESKTRGSGVGVPRVAETI